MFNPLRYLVCVFGHGHSWTNSKKKKGMMTCKRCRLRRKWR